MRNCLLIFCLLVSSFGLKAQDDDPVVKAWRDSLRKINTRHTISDLFWNSSCNGTFYCGLTNSFEMNSYYMGGEFKLYDSYYTPNLSMSAYTSFRVPVAHFGEVHELKAISAGASLSFVGFEATAYFNREKTWYCLTPKAGYDYGSWSAFYGFSFPLSSNPYSGIYRHSVNIQYHLYLSTFGYHRMRKHNYGY